MNAAELPPAPRDFCPLWEPRRVVGMTGPLAVVVDGHRFTVGAGPHHLLAWAGEIAGAKEPGHWAEAFRLLLTPTPTAVEVGELLCWATADWRLTQDGDDESERSLGGYQWAPGVLLGRKIDRVRLALVLSWFAGGEVLAGWSPSSEMGPARHCLTLVQGRRRAALMGVNSGDCDHEFLPLWGSR